MDCLGVRGKLVLISALILTGAGTWAHDSEVFDDDEISEETVPQDTYVSPTVDPSEKIYIAENFDDADSFSKKWIKSEAKKQGVDEDLAKYNGIWELQMPTRKIFNNDLGLVLTTEAKHAAISALLDQPFEFRDKPLVVQYEVTMQEGQICGGAYIKLLSKGTDTEADLRKFNDQTPYTIMFGPDKCGNDNKLHFIFRHKNPKTGIFEEKHAKKQNHRLEEYYQDKEPHLYRLVVEPDNTYTISIDNRRVNTGSLLNDFQPPVNPPEEIFDPYDKKPKEWDDREQVVDPEARKPEDWDEDAPAQIEDPNAVKPDDWLDDEPETIPDPQAKKPEDWDNEMDGEWEAPLIDNPLCTSGCGAWAPPQIPNPNYKGKWRPPLIPNPNFKGKWTPRSIPNPDYFKDDNPFSMTPIHAVGFELWSMSPSLLFDNLIITNDESVALEWARESFDLKKAKITKDSDSVVDVWLAYANANPWVWGVAIFVVLVIVGSIVYCCCADVSKDPEVDAKKTDAYTADDPHVSEAEPESEPPLEPRGEPEEDEKPQAESEGEEPAPRSKKHLEGPPHADTANDTPAESEGAGDGQRKRKSRKE